MTPEHERILLYFMTAAMIVFFWYWAVWGIPGLP